MGKQNRNTNGRTFSEDGKIGLEGQETTTLADLAGSIADALDAKIAEKYAVQLTSLLALMREWDNMQEWVSKSPRKYLPRAEVLAKLLSLRPF